MLSVVRRRNAGGCFEGSYKLRRRVESALESYVENRECTIRKQLLGVSDAQAGQILFERNTDLLMKNSRTMGRGNTDGVCNFGKRDVACKAIVHISDGLSYKGDIIFQMDLILPFLILTICIF